jgi:hypothetical protein
MARWGLQVNSHGTSLSKLTSILVYVLRLLFHTVFCTGRTYVKQTLDGAKILNDSTEKQYDNFSPGIAKLRTLCGFVKDEEIWEMLLRRLFSAD